METLFRTVDFYSKNLIKLGYEAIDSIAMLLKNGIFLISKDLACANIYELNNKGRILYKFEMAQSKNPVISQIFCNENHKLK